MKVQVTKKAKGELFIRAIGKAMRVGAEITLNDDQFYDSATQAAIQAGFLDVVDGPTEKAVKGEEYINVYKNSLSFKCIRRAIPSGSTFFVREDLVGDHEIVAAFNAGYIELADPEPKDSKEAGSAETPKKEKSSKKATRKRSGKKSSKKSTKRIKRVGSDKEADADAAEVKVSVGKPPEESPVEGDEPTDTHALPKKSQVEAPEGMYAHDPTGEGVSVRKASAPNDIFGDDSNDVGFVESTPDADDISFVDEEQTRERAKKSGIADDIFDDNVEVE
tara:strand:+ start:25675 stop:26505 length:831 start_codon:yes stop_codon:yes gene_type:complete